ncbi:osmoprotectant ABC transporter substrate-binding protein [Companilactobacillus sp.]|jgi:osmoprotectant transport system substrate-binding protein|uniref:osmoprotectant ABC transporter substrate-binding protein n=1 Tax=Companilactobacillus sp. TaxID=2767905 RepID=UPI0025C36692|nr:osmoprotectant ABC transporter substrate-binding protein [Companilactobacillus sp.]MCH4009087.1 osmoprotectant ABC transporter substrate-binding protein [Companilactobacillus sp.]MCH4050734.1 osmoprotectant ABC transporter substrate-binding protein [Companilactobacillus sp.]MCH4077029.1 osmoprotectant ABC transporter substrate-binding protein [Companilactobacillus sp.]MCH4125605.1 osmoprotectant ABC transporter substrate-binding protein [Companilactobacillus sp.]MCI1311314.1 osmoprotectant 
MKKFKKIITLFCLSLLIFVSGCGWPGLGSTSKDTIKVASLSTTESMILAEIIMQLISHETDHHTEIVNNLGSGQLVHQALVNGDADIASDNFTGNELITTLNHAPIKDEKTANRVIKKLYKSRFDETWMPTYGFQNTYNMLVTQETAKKYHLNKISDMKSIASKIDVGADNIWVNRPDDGYKPFSQAYGFEFKRVYPMQIGLVYSAVAAGKMSAVLGYSTDGRIKSYNLKILPDDKNFFPPYDASMVVNNSLLRKYPELKPLLHRLDGNISLSQMQTMNYQVDNDLREPEDVAHEFLVKHNYFRGDK